MKLKSVLLGSVLALFSITFAVAQGNVSVGVRGGVTIPGLMGGSGDPVSEGYSTATRFGAAVFAEIKFSQLFSLQPMLEYSQEGAKRSGMQALVATGSDPELAGAFPAAWQAAIANAPELGQLAQLLPSGFPAAPNYLYADAKRDAKMDYLMLPVLAKFGWNFTKESPWRVYVSAGPYVGLLLNAKNIVCINGGVYSDKSGSALIQLPDEVVPSIPETMLPALTGAIAQISNGLSANMVSNLSGTQNIKDQLYKFIWGFQANVGLQYQIQPRHRVFVEVGGNYGMMNIQKSTGKDSAGTKQYFNGKNHIGAATIMVGYAYTL